MKKLFFAIKQILKMILQNIVFPCTYKFWSIIYRNKPLSLIVFADAHHDEIPQSMICMHNELKKRGYEITDVFHNYSRVGQLHSFLYAMKFMKLYAKAKYVFICDNFLPVASCKKNENTQVVQLWHSCGLLKKMGYDTDDDIPASYHGNVYKNYNLVTVSAPCCEVPLSNAMHQKRGIVKALGVSRTDRYFDSEWIKQCKDDFFREYPEATGKIIILWAPTFRGNAANPYQVGMEAIRNLEKNLDDRFYLLIKVHPHVDEKEGLSNCKISTENLLPIVDIMITDYSSVLFDFLFFRKPYVLFAPDLNEFVRKREFYVDYYLLTPYVAFNEHELKEKVIEALNSKDNEWIDKCYKYHLNACDGQSTKRILEYLEL